MALKCRSSRVRIRLVPPRAAITMIDASGRANPLRSVAVDELDRDAYVFRPEVHQLIGSLGPPRSAGVSLRRCRHAWREDSRVPPGRRETGAGARIGLRALRVFHVGAGRSRLRLGGLWCRGRSFAEAGQGFGDPLARSGSLLAKSGNRGRGSIALGPFAQSRSGSVGLGSCPCASPAVEADVSAARASRRSSCIIDGSGMADARA